MFAMSFSTKEIEVQEIKYDPKFPSVPFKGKTKLLFTENPLKVSLKKVKKYQSEDTEEKLMVSLDESSKSKLEKVFKFCEEELSKLDKPYRKYTLDRPYTSNDYGDTLFLKVNKFSKVKGDKFGDGKLIVNVGGILLIPELKKAKIQLYLKSVLIKNTSPEMEIEDW